MEHKINVTIEDVEALNVPINRKSQPELPARDEFIATHDEVKVLSLQLLDKKATRTRTDEQIQALQKKLNLAKGRLWDIENRLASMRI